ncbi:hypothetical protein DDE82_003152 [Stemphylium lycopersici]|nr:hypothetical protein DDE82_003152 [Stemphylium lycopersici]
MCNPTMMLMNPGPVSFMKLYANWSDEDKTNFRAGKEKENEVASEDEDSNAEWNSGDYSAQEITLDLNALVRGARGGGNSILFMGKQMSQPVSLIRSSFPPTPSSG